MQSSAYHSLARHAAHQACGRLPSRSPMPSFLISPTTTRTVTPAFTRSAYFRIAKSSQSPLPFVHVCIGVCQTSAPAGSASYLTLLLIDLLNSGIGAIGIDGASSMILTAFHLRRSGSSGPATIDLYPAKLRSDMARSLFAMGLWW